MLEIKTLTQITENELREFIVGYSSNQKYVVTKKEDDTRTQITLELTMLDEPYIKRWGKDDVLESHYSKVLEQKLSLCAYLNGEMVAIAIAEEQSWNHTLLLWEFHVLKEKQGKGIGIQLMEALKKRAYTAGLRAIVCETQNTNLPAIRFYRRLGFEIDGVDLSYYTNHDIHQGEVAIFMKFKLNVE
jgi:ribosomal protein S18 acetylase RimI-like enzyme